MISVLLPVKNGGEHLFAALDSLQQQTYADFECLVIDDASNDGACDQITTRFDSRFQVIPNQGAGIVDALNTGLSIASRPLIARMDADDIAMSQRFEKQLALLATNKGVGFCGTKIAYFSDSKPIDQGLQLYQTWINAQQTHQQIQQNMFVECAIPHPTFMIRRSLFEKIGGYQDHGWPEDYDLVLRAYIHQTRFGKPQDVLLKWRDHHSRLSRNDERYTKHAFINAKAHYFARSPLHQAAQNKQQQIIIWGAGKTGKYLSEQLTNHHVTITAFVDISPKRIGKNIQSIPIYDAMTFDFNQCLVLIAVGTRGIRQMIEEHFSQQPYQQTVIAMA